MRASFICTLAITITLSAEEPQFPSVPPQSAEKAQHSFHLLDGFEMQLIAAEPLVTDPVAITYDEDGRAYVCEMSDYPYTDKTKHKPSQENPSDLPIGKVRLLEDTDGDGVYDKSTLFAEGLSWPTGAACWKGGIFVTATPDVWYLKDTDGDGQADIREKVFTGFRKLNIQAVMNNPQWGLDHRIYIAGGSNGASITQPAASDIPPVVIRRHDVSFDPSSHDLRMESGGARFGNSFDDWGNRFLCNIRNPCQHIVLPYGQLTRNPYLATTAALNDCAEAGDQLPVYRTSPVEPWRDFRAKRWTNEGSHLPKSELVGAGVVTSSSGITLYRGDAYPKAYRDFAFVNDVAGNLFYRMKLIPDGITFKAIQVDEMKNFCTSDDIWFRPVNFTNAPDGCLHICDMYREVIEHPWSIPDDIHAKLDLLSGNDKGRLWRLAPKGHRPRRTPRLSQFSTSELVALLDHPNAWHRDSAHRLIHERQDPAAIPPLHELIGGAQTTQGQVHALWSLQGLQALNDQDLVTALKNPHPEVQAAAMHLGEGRWSTLLAKENLTDLLQEPSPAVQRQVAFQITHLTKHLTTEHTAHLLNSTSRDPWLERAVLTLPPDSADELLFLILSQKEITESSLIRQLASIAAQSARQAKTSDALLSRLLALTPRLPTDVIIGLDEGFRRQGKKLRELIQATPASESFTELSKQALDTVQNRPQAEQDRLNALALLRATGEPKLLITSAASLMTPGQPPALQAAALDALSGERSPEIAPNLIQLWPSLSPALRNQTLSSLLSYPERISALLDAVESRVIPTSQINTAARTLLAKNKDKTLAHRAAKLFDNANSNRSEVVARYQTALSRMTSADAARGEKVYQLACMACHKHGQQGNDVGPHLGTVQAWTPELLLTNILDPNREVSPNFALYIVETRDGRSLAGILTSETASSFTLKRADGGEESLNRSDIQTLTSPGTSLMPEGLEAAISPEQMADLIAFLTAKQ